MSDQNDARAFRHLFRVRYSECDPQNIVFNGRYAEYVDMSITEFMRTIGLEYKALIATGFDIQVARLAIDWKGSARFDDVICAEIECTRVGRTSYRLQVNMSRWSDGAPLIEAEVIHVLVKHGVWEKTPVSDEIRARLLNGAPGQLTDHAGAGAG